MCKAAANLSISNADLITVASRRNFLNMSLFFWGEDISTMRTRVVVESTRREMHFRRPLIDAMPTILSSTEAKKAGRVDFKAPK